MEISENIGGLGGGSMIKGFLMGCFGLFLGTIGTDGLTGQLRFTFGIDGLYSGISTVPALIGLFSISQALVLSEQYLAFKQGIHRTVDEESMKGKFLPIMKEIVQLIPNFIRSAIIGVVVGILPGAGGDIGAWFAYSQAKKASKHPEEFGEGSLEAICASETANNAKYHSTDHVGYSGIYSCSSSFRSIDPPWFNSWTVHVHKEYYNDLHNYPWIYPCEYHDGTDWYRDLPPGCKDHKGIRCDLNSGHCRIIHDWFLLYQQPFQRCILNVGFRSDRLPLQET